MNISVSKSVVPWCQKATGNGGFAPAVALGTLSQKCP
jgi:hypothetical protein